MGVWTSKPGSGTLTLMDGGQVIRHSRIHLSGGSHVLNWAAPPGHRRYTLRLDAVSLNRLASSSERTLGLH